MTFFLFLWLQKYFTYFLTILWKSYSVVCDSFFVIWRNFLWIWQNYVLPYTATWFWFSSEIQFTYRWFSKLNTNPQIEKTWNSLDFGLKWGLFSPRSLWCRRQKMLLRTFEGRLNAEYMKAEDVRIWGCKVYWAFWWARQFWIFVDFL